MRVDRVPGVALCSGGFIRRPQGRGLKRLSNAANAGRFRYVGRVHRRTLPTFFYAHFFRCSSVDRRRSRCYGRRMPVIDPDTVVVLDYTNHAGKRAMRRVVPLKLWFGESEYHPAAIGPQWYLRALDIDKGDPEQPTAPLPERDFLFTSIHESITLGVWEKRSRDDERWRLQQQAWQNANR